MAKVTYLQVRGRNDGVLRRVEHLPINKDTRCTQPDVDHFVMRLWTENGPVRQVIAAQRIIATEVTEYGQGLDVLRQHPRS